MKLMLVCSNKEFNNGLIVQWGNHFYNNYTPLVTLPITYKQAHLQCFATVAQQSEAGISAYNLTLSTVSIIAGGGYYKRYLSIGI